jgi:light-regulated signal transduction histidine kinase (bacteriophytochrome)
MDQTAEQRVAQLEAELAALRGEMRDFTYTVSHDLRASLRHILSYAHLVQEDAGPQLSTEVQGFLGTITESARHMGVLMDGLMELSRIGSVPMQTDPVPLQTLVSEVVQLLPELQGQRAVAWRIAQDLPVVTGDVTLLRQAFTLVLGNAVKFTQQMAQADISVQLVGQDAHTVTVAVQDNGAGFNPALQSKLFHPFQRLHSTKQFPGIGMGLALTRKIVERHGGRVSAQGAVGDGCTVTLSLPKA